MWGTRAQGVTLAGLIAGGSLIAGMALAQDPPNPFAGECNRTATPEEVEGARGAHQAAKQFYERAEYARAIQYWRDVFNFDCNAIGTLLNIANAYERLGDRQNAIFALEVYVKRVPEGTDVSKIQTRIQNLKDLQAQAAASASAAASANAPPPPSASTPPPPPSATTPPVMVKPYGTTPWAVVGVGATVTVVGAILFTTGWIKANPEECTTTDDIKYVCTSKTAVEGAKVGQILVPAGKVALGVGGAAMVGGLIWEYLANQPVAQEPDKPMTGRVRLSPAVSPNMTGALIHGTF